MDIRLVYFMGKDTKFCMQTITYVNEGSPEEVTDFQTFTYLEVNKAITYIRFKIKE
jgi:hypothetical protein